MACQEMSLSAVLMRVDFWTGKWQGLKQECVKGWKEYN